VGHDVRLASNLLLTSAAREDYLDWIRSNRAAWLRRRRMPPVASTTLNAYIAGFHMRWVDALNLRGKLPFVWRVADYRLYEPQYLHRYLFPWALMRAKKRYASSMIWSEQ
jgi:hypothetical protein